jgi:hypothetical protein
VADRQHLECPLACGFSILPPPNDQAAAIASDMMDDHLAAHPPRHWLAEVTRLRESPNEALCRALASGPEAVSAMIAPFTDKAVSELRIAAETVRIACVAELLDRRDR